MTTKGGVDGTQPGPRNQGVEGPVASPRRLAALKAAATVRRLKAEIQKRRKEAGRKSAAKKQTPPFKAKVAARRSQEALAAWAKSKAWRLVFLDSESGNPRTGIVDAVLLRIAPGRPDVVQARLVQLKGGGAGLTAGEVIRLEAAVAKMEVSTMYALYDGTDLTTMVRARVAGSGMRTKP